MDKMAMKFNAIFMDMAFLIKNSSQLKVFQSKRLRSFLLILCFTLLQCFGLATNAWAKTAAELATQINGMGIVTLSAFPAGNVVTVSGSAILMSTTLTLDIDNGVTVKWGAGYRTTMTMTGPMIQITGDGTFEVDDFVVLENLGSGATIYSSGKNASIIVSRGTVLAGGGNAILVDGQNSTVTVRGTGAVNNQSTTNVRPVIQMSNQSNNSLNVIVTDNGSVTVSQPLGRGYAIQTYGDVAISGNANVYTRGDNWGRAINALGDDSKVTVSGNSTVWAEDGIAISAGKSVTVSGGLVYNSGIDDSHAAIDIRGGTGLNVIINGTGQVEARGVGGTAIKSPGDVEIRDNAKVSATDNGYAIHTTGSGAVTVSGGMVTATTGNAIRTSGGAVRVNGGFVFAYGSGITGANNVIYPASAFSSATGTGVVVAWDNRTVPTTYMTGYNTHIFQSPATGATAVWRRVGEKSGISYVNGTNSGFFPLPVNVTPDSDYGLIFAVEDSGDISAGKFYLNVDGSGIPKAVNEYSGQNSNYTWEAGTTSGNLGTLTLTNFKWSTISPGVLNIGGGSDPFNDIINNGTLTIKLEGNNDFSSITDTTASKEGYVTSFGIYSLVNDIVIEGTGTLNAISGNLATEPPAESSLGIFMMGNLEINGGTVNAQGGNAPLLSVGIAAGMSINSIKIDGGTLNARAGNVSSIPGAFSLGIGTNKLHLDSGTLEAIGSTYAFGVLEGYDGLDAYTYWTNTDAVPPEIGTLYYPGSGAPEYVLSTDHKYVKITSERVAVVSDVTIDGMVGKVLTGMSPATVTLYGDTIGAMSNVNVSSWFTSLPSGVSVMASAAGNTITLTFSGTPSVASTAAFDITIPSSRLAGGALTVQPNPNARFNIVNQVIPTITSGNSYNCMELTGGSFQVSATGTSPITYSLAGHPSGVSISSTTGMITVAGTVAVGIYNFTITAGNEAGSSAPQNFTLWVQALPIAPTIISDNAYRCVEGIADTFQVIAVGTSPITYSLTGHPAGVSINSTTGLITITNTLAVNTYNFTITAVNVAGSYSQSFTLRVGAAPIPPRITSDNNYHCVEGTGGSFTLTAIGTAPITFSSSSNVPEGVYISENNLIITKTVMVGTYNFTIIASNMAGSSDPQNFTLSVLAAPVVPAITSVNNYQCMTGTGGVFPLTATGTTPIAFSLGGAPTGVSIGGHNLIVASTVAAGTYRFTITASNEAGDSDPQNFILTVTSAPIPPKITSANTFDYVKRGMVSTFPLTATGTAPIDYSLSGPVPNGVYIGGRNLIVADTVAAGVYKFIITANNEAGKDEQEFTLTITSEPVLPIITSANNHDCVEGTESIFQLTATGTEPITFSLGDAPEGVSISRHNLVVANTVEAGTYTFTITANNVAGDSEPQLFTLTVSHDDSGGSSCCGCNSTGAGALMVMLLPLLALVKKRGE